MKNFPPIIWGLIALGLGSCTTIFRREVPAPRNTITAPYTVNGYRYYPQKHLTYDEVGIASFYGKLDGFHGKLTAYGHIFDEHLLTAAHKELPIPCVARVTRVDTGRSIKVLINDRGPFIDGRIIDLSKNAARKLSFVKDGVAKVRVQVLPSESIRIANLYRNKKHKKNRRLLARYLNHINSQPSRTTIIRRETFKKPGNKPPKNFRHIKRKSIGKSKPIGSGFFVITENFSNERYASKVADHFSRQGYKATLVKIPPKMSIKLFVVRIGPHKKSVAQGIMRKLKKLGFMNSKLVFHSTSGRKKRR